VFSLFCRNHRLRVHFIDSPEKVEVIDVVAPSAW
jgi:hypothetical protein